MHSGLQSPPGVWWKPAHKAEKVWVAIAFGWCMVLFAMMPIMHVKGGQNVSGIRHTVEPAAFSARVAEFVNQYQVGTDGGYPVVAPPPGSHVYLMATSFAWFPVLQLEKGVEYILHISALDVNHGFSLLPLNVNLQIVPGYDYGLRVTPTEAGDFRIVCNEFCGIGHHMMVGKVIVTDGPNTVVNPTAMITGGKP
jgi:cytochrome c oxidase subunit II